MRFVAVVLVSALGLSCVQRREPDPLPVREVRQAEAELGFEPTRNFRRHGGRNAYYLCYATGPLELPSAYGGLQMDQGREGSCRFNPDKLDVFVYPAEALAGRKAPVTASLAAAEPARRDFVVAHEDFHEQPGVRQLDPALKEAVSTLAGFLTAAEAARVRGDEAGAAQALREADLFLGKADRINTAHAELAAVYAAYRQGKLSEAEALAQKQQVFERLERACAEVANVPQAFHPCPAALNNAGLAFDATYTREYPRVYALLEESGRDPAATVARLRELAE